MRSKREQKKEIIKELEEKIEKQKAMIFVDFSGLKAKEIFDLRKELKASQNELKVVKKTLMGIALKRREIEFEPKKLPGQLAVVFGYKDEILPAKICWQFSQRNPNLKILGSWLENRFFEKEKVIELAKLPSREELLGKLVGSISAPISNFVNVLKGNLRNFVFILSQISKVEQ